MTTGANPYVVPDAAAGDTDPAANVLEVTLTAEHWMVDIGGGIMANAETFNRAIPGPTFFLTVGDTVIVRLINLLDHPLGIHWHGIELANSADGTEVTQESALPMFATPPPSPAPAGGTYLYKFKVPRPGLFWYHPHSHGSTNRVFRGLYGMIVVADNKVNENNEATLVQMGVIPDPADPAQTRQLVLSDITVCKTRASMMRRRMTSRRRGLAAPAFRASRAGRHLSSSARSACLREMQGTNTECLPCRPMAPATSQASSERGRPTKDRRCSPTA